MLNKSSTSDTHLILLRLLVIVLTDKPKILAASVFELPLSIAPRTLAFVSLALSR